MGFVKKKAVIVQDEEGFPNYMTMFYLEPLLSKTPEVKINVPQMFKVGGKTVAAVLISQYTNVMINNIPASLPYKKPVENVSYTDAAALCRKKGRGWHLMTNTEWVYLMDEADRLGHKIGGNTKYGRNAENPEEHGVCYDGYTTLTGLDPLSWSHDGTKSGVFGLCGNFWEWVTGLRLHNGIIEFIKDNDAALQDYGPESPAWVAATAGEETGLPFGDPLKLDVQCGQVVLTDGDIAGQWGGRHFAEMKLAGSLKEVPEILHRLGVIPRNWQQEKAGIWVDSSEKETVPVRGSGFGSTSNGGVAALGLYYVRTFSDYDVSFRSALFLEDWELVAELLGRA